MNPSSPPIVRILAAGYGLLWAGGVIAYGFKGGPPPGTAWAAPAFLFLALLLALAIVPPHERPGWLAVGLWGFGWEVVGVHTGFPFGAYAYNRVLSPNVLGVPIVMAGAWIALLAYSRQLASRLPGPRWAQSLAGAGWMVAIDLVIDPLAASSLGYWTWTRAGLYYGIPATNFAGWFFVSFPALAAWPPPRARDPALDWLGGSLLAFFALIALTTGFEFAGAIGLGLCAAQVGLTHRRRPPRAPAALQSARG